MVWTIFKQLELMGMFKISFLRKAVAKDYGLK